jgi:hypothetical protein
LNFQFSTLVGMEFKEQARKERELGLPVLSMMEETEVLAFACAPNARQGTPLFGLHVAAHYWLRVAVLYDTWPVACCMPRGMLPLPADWRS